MLWLFIDQLIRIHPLVRMETIGLIVVLLFGILILVSITTSCRSGKEGFSSPTIPKQTFLNTKREEPKGNTEVSDLPSAPVTGLAEANSLPFQDPALAKATLQQLNELKQDMDGFASNELPGLEKKSDPAVKLPLMRFKGDYQRVKDEVVVLRRNEGIQSQLTFEDVSEMAANLRFLQRTYRLYALNQLVPVVDTPLSKVGLNMPVENFSNFENTPSESSTPISPDQLDLLAGKLQVEITRLQASGTTDPVLQARVNVLTNIQQTVDDLNTKVKDGSLPPSQIPIMIADFKNFLPVLKNTNVPIQSPITKAVPPTKPGKAIVKKEIVKKETPRGEFEETVKKLEATPTSSVRPPSIQPTTIGSFDWKKRVEDITQNIRRAGMNPADFGTLQSGAKVGPDFSWRGHAKMICSRLATVADPGIPEQLGCPPVSWKGWRA